MNASLTEGTRCSLHFLFEHLRAGAAKGMPDRLATEEDKTFLAGKEPLCVVGMSLARWHDPHIEQGLDVRVHTQLIVGRAHKGRRGDFGFI